MNESTWSKELGTSGVMKSGRWLQLHAVTWAAFLSAYAVALFISTQYSGLLAVAVIMYCSNAVAAGR